VDFSTIRIVEYSENYESKNDIRIGLGAFSSSFSISKNPPREQEKFYKVMSSAEFKSRCDFWIYHPNLSYMNFSYRHSSILRYRKT